MPNLPGSVEARTMGDLGVAPGLAACTAARAAARERTAAGEDEGSQLHDYGHMPTKRP